MISFDTFILYSRSFIFNVCGFIATIFISVFFVPLLLLPTPYVMWIPRLWIKTIFFLLKHITHLTFEIRGIIPQKPVLIASKHQSTFETLVFHEIFKSPVYFLKQELLYVPVFGWYLRKAGMIPVKRHRGSLPFKTLQNLALKKLKEGHNLILFPEGTRTAPDVHIPYKSGVSFFYHALNCDVIPVALNSGLFWGRRSFLKRPGHIIIEFLPAIPPGMNPKMFLKKLESTIEEKTKELVNDSKST